MVGRRLVIAALWLLALVLAILFRDEAPGALPAALAGGFVLLLTQPVTRWAARRKNGP
ncbi:hypothetical protein SAMN05421507_102612 [Lentzea jiangxiensis]|uniref:Uncharacterized protein n=2 Tax=Lentzea jiangxiensis TaxID=641025 RepID=A0A1H0JSG7_9PSEU|nr:hypothetical protein SAMN05421507_102612 [Lentzea jiangxiensis]